MRIVLALVFLSPLIGCRGTPVPPEAVQSGNGGVAYRYEGADGAAADRLALLYCANLGRQKSLVEVAREGDRRIAYYRCL